jgi:cytidine deaminase
MTDKTTIYQSLMETAVSAREFSYSPYSGYRVGVALLGKSGKVYTGCNVENAGYTPTNCAERTAVFKAVSEGERAFAMLAVAGGKDGKIAGAFPPCGVCRQMLSEFCSPEMPILLVRDADGTADTYTLGDLLPLAFKLD